MKVGRYLEYRFTDIRQHIVFSWLLLSIVSSTLIGLFYWLLFTTLGNDYPDSIYHFVSTWHARGLCATSIFLILLSGIRTRNLSLQLMLTVIAILAGSIIAQILMDLIQDEYGMFSHLYAGLSFRDQLIASHFSGEILHTAIVLSTLFGIVFYLEWAFGVEKNLEEEKNKRIAVEHTALQSHLRALKAQIEPHFLFNTLGNILNLLDTDLDKGIAMQDDLIQYLRSSLPKIRLDATTLGQEVEMIRAYLDIFKIRMGDRLTYQIQVPDMHKAIEFPPMLIQPLVENAIKHGIDPKLEGGEITISTHETENCFHLEVTDTGVGLKNDSCSHIGLTNIQARLSALYGNNGRLILKENQPSGLKAVIEVAYS